MANNIGIGVVVLVKIDGKILLGKRLSEVGFGEWGLPSGKLMPGESMVAGAKRELLEETGLTVDDLEFINITNDVRRTDDHWIHLVFLAKGIHGQPKVMETDKCESWEWFSTDKLPKPLFYGHTKLLEAILNKKLIFDS
jgi:8-oxo-dGTP diphosphatase